MNSNAWEGQIESGLTISALARRTGVPEATLRTWEARYGAPRPRRLPGGHRRYTEQDVTLIEQVLRQRATGLGLETAIARAAATVAEPEPSVFAGLRKRDPALAPRVLSKRTLLGLTRAIEDECCARAAHPVLFASFQSQRFFRQSQARWRELARTAAHVSVFADFADAGSAHGLNRVPVSPGAPLAREWMLVCDADDHPACVTGWELPGQTDVTDADRRYEVLWTLEPPTVREAARICADLAVAFDAPTPPRVLERLEGTTPPASPDLKRVMMLFNRVVGYVDAPSA